MMSIDDLPHQVDSDQPNEATPLSCFDAAAEAAMAGPGAPPGRGITFTGIVTAVRNAVSSALTTAPPLSSPQVHSAILDAIPRVAQFTKQARERAASGLPTGPTKRSGPPNLIWTCPLACKCSPRRSSHFPTVQRSSGPPPSAVPSGYGPPPGMADGGTRQQAQAGGIHPLEQVRSPLIALDCP